MDLERFIRHFNSLDKSVAPNKYMDYPQVPSFILTENPRTQSIWI